MGLLTGTLYSSGSLVVRKQWHCLKPAVVCRPEIRWQIHHDVVGSQLPWCLVVPPLS
jgi:hypothetical protein